MVYFKLKGLSIKAVKGTNFGHDLCRDEGDGKYYISLEYGKMDGRTAKIESGKLIEYLKELHECIQFTTIKQIGHYELTGDQLMDEVLKNQ